MKINIIITSIILNSSAYAAELQYDITQIGTHSPNFAFRPFNINDQELILGHQKDPSEHRSPFYPFIAKPNSNDVEWDLFSLPYYFTSMNNLGQLVGSSVADGVYIGDEISGDISYLDIAYSGSSIIPSDINDGGQIVGYSRLENNIQYHAFITNNIGNNWTMTDLGTLGGADSYAHAINNSGIVVGHSEISNTSTVANAFVAFKTNNGWVMTNLGTLGGNNSYAIDINNSNQVVGFSDHPDGTQHAFIASQNTTGIMMTDLGSARNNYIYQNNTIQINDSGYVVWNDLDTAYLYAKGQKYKLIDLIPSHPEWETVAKVTSINNKGQIVGSGKSSPDGDCCAGYILTPIFDAPPPVCETGVDPQTIREGEGTALWWWSQNVTDANINNSIGTIDVPSDYKWIYPTETTTFTMTAQGANGSTTTCETTVIVEGQSEPNPPICSLGVDPQIITAGEGTALWWWTQNASTANIDNNIGEIELPSQYKWISPLATTTFRMNVLGTNGETTMCQTTITVE